MEGTVRCYNCRQDFVPDKVYEFPNCLVYWHKCMMGSITQIIVPKEKKRFWRKPDERYRDRNINRTIESFHDPWLWYKKHHEKNREYDEENQ